MHCELGAATRTLAADILFLVGLNRAVGEEEASQRDDVDGDRPDSMRNPERVRRLLDPASPGKSSSHHHDLAVGFDDGRAVSGPLHGSTPLLRGSERVVCLAHRDDLAVAGLQQEPELGQQAWGHSESMLPCQRERC